MRGLIPVGIGKWILIALGFATFLALAVGFLGLALDLSPRRLLLPYGLLLYTHFISGVLVYWAQGARARPKAFAFRLALAIFMGMEFLQLALAYSVHWVGLLSWEDIMYYFSPSSMLVCSALFSVSMYVIIRRRLDVAKPE